MKVELDLVVLHLLLYHRSELSRPTLIFSHSSNGPGLIKYFIDKTRRGLTTVLTKEPEVHIYKHCMKLTWHRNLLHACHSQVNNTEYVTWKQTSRNWVQRRGLNGLLVYVHISYLVLQIAQTPGIRYSIFVRNNAAHIIAHRIDYAMQFKKGLGKVESWWTHLWASW